MVVQTVRLRPSGLNGLRMCDSVAIARERSAVATIRRKGSGWCAFARPLSGFFRHRQRLCCDAAADQGEGGGQVLNGHGNVRARIGPPSSGPAMSTTPNRFVKATRARPTAGVGRPHQRSSKLSRSRLSSTTIRNCVAFARERVGRAIAQPIDGASLAGGESILPATGLPQGLAHRHRAPHRHVD
jgi:hypothetical protein